MVSQRHVSSAASRPSSSTESDAKPDSLRELGELREALRKAEAAEAAAIQRRETAGEDVKTWTEELFKHGYHRQSDGDFEAWFKKQQAEVDAMLSEVEAILNA